MNGLVQLWKNLISTSVALTFFSSILKSKHLDLFHQVNIFLHETHCKQLCLVIKSLISFFINLISLRYLWASRLVSSFCLLCRRHAFFRKKIGSYCPSYIASLATWSMLIDNCPLLIFQLVHVIYSEQWFKKIRWKLCVNC